MRSRFVLGVAMVAASLWTARCSSSHAGGGGSGRAAVDAGSGVGSDAGSGRSTMHTLFVDINGPGGANGRAGSRPDGIACGSSCSAQFADGTDIELTAAPDQNSIFGAWEGGSCSGTSPTCGLHLTTDAHVTAVFQLAPQECAGLRPDKPVSITLRSCNSDGGPPVSPRR